MLFRSRFEADGEPASAGVYGVFDVFGPIEYQAREVRELADAHYGIDILNKTPS